jgi:hypothetical protein
MADHIEKAHRLVDELADALPEMSEWEAEQVERVAILVDRGRELLKLLGRVVERRATKGIDVLRVSSVAGACVRVCERVLYVGRPFVHSSRLVPPQTS